LLVEPYETMVFGSPKGGETDRGNS
mgnify:CR=1